jgi:MarR family transcriptional regulator, lower aerobic nicotinate degradation pathway regulator
MPSRKSLTSGSEGPRNTGLMPYNRVAIALSRRLYQISVAVAAEVHVRSGVTPLEFGTLIHLNKRPGMDQNTLAAISSLDRTSTSALVYKLERKHLIAREVNGADRRARVLRLTPAGQALHDRLLPRAHAAQESVLSVLSPAERKSLIDMLVRVIEANERYVRPGAGRRKPVRTTAKRER